MTLRRPYHRGPCPLFDAFFFSFRHVVFTLNNWGELRLDPGLLPHEHRFLRMILPFHLGRRDVHLVGEIVDALQSFGDSATGDGRPPAPAAPATAPATATVVAW